MISDRVKCAVPSPGTVGVGSTVTLGAAPSGFRTFLAAFGGGASCYFVLSDGAGRALFGIWTVNASVPETATVTAVLGNDRVPGALSETFSGSAVAFNTIPALRAASWGASGLQVGQNSLGPFAGLRNLVINGNPTINQRGYVSGDATTVGNQYTLDRFRVVTSGQAISWSDSAGIRTVTVPAGGLEQVIEGSSIIAGVHTLSWVGTATATVNGVVVANGGQVTLPGGANATIRLSGGTWALLQLEPGSVVTPFERRNIALEETLCKRYFEAGNCKHWGNADSAGQVIGQTVSFMVQKRSTPTITTFSVGLTNCALATPEPTSTGCGFIATSSAVGSTVFSLGFHANSEL